MKQAVATTWWRTLNLNPPSEAINRLFFFFNLFIFCWSCLFFQATTWSDCNKSLQCATAIAKSLITMVRNAGVDNTVDSYTVMMPMFAFLCRH